MNNMNFGNTPPNIFDSYKDNDFQQNSNSSAPHFDHGHPNKSHPANMHYEQNRERINQQERNWGFEPTDMAMNQNRRQSKPLSEVFSVIEKLQNYANATPFTRKNASSIFVRAVRAAGTTYVMDYIKSDSTIHRFHLIVENLILGVGKSIITKRARLDAYANALKRLQIFTVAELCDTDSSDTPELMNKLSYRTTIDSDPKRPISDLVILETEKTAVRRAKHAMSILRRSVYFSKMDLNKLRSNVGDVQKVTILVQNKPVGIGFGSSVTKASINAAADALFNNFYRKNPVVQAQIEDDCSKWIPWRKIKFLAQDMKGIGGHSLIAGQDISDRSFATAVQKLVDTHPWSEVNNELLFGPGMSEDCIKNLHCIAKERNLSFECRRNRQLGNYYIIQRYYDPLDIVKCLEKNGGCKGRYRLIPKNEIIQIQSDHWEPKSQVWKKDMKGKSNEVPKPRSSLPKRASRPSRTAGSDRNFDNSPSPVGRGFDNGTLSSMSNKQKMAINDDQRFDQRSNYEGRGNVNPHSKERYFLPNNNDGRFDQRFTQDREMDGFNDGEFRQMSRSDNEFRPMSDSCDRDPKQMSWPDNRGFGQMRQSDDRGFEQMRQPGDRGFEQMRQPDDRGFGQMRQPDDRGFGQMRQTDDRGFEQMRQTDDRGFGQMPDDRGFGQMPDDRGFGQMPDDRGFGQMAQSADRGFGQMRQPDDRGFGQMRQPDDRGFEQMRQPDDRGFGQMRQPDDVGFGQTRQPDDRGFGQMRQPDERGFEQMRQHDSEEFGQMRRPDDREFGQMSRPNYEESNQTSYNDRRDSKQTFWPHDKELNQIPGSHDRDFRETSRLDTREFRRMQNLEEIQGHSERGMSDNFDKDKMLGHDERRFNTNYGYTGRDFNQISNRNEREFNSQFHCNERDMRQSHDENYKQVSDVNKERFTQNPYENRLDKLSGQSDIGLHHSSNYDRRFNENFDFDKPVSDPDKRLYNQLSQQSKRDYSPHSAVSCDDNSLYPKVPNYDDRRLRFNNDQVTRMDHPKKQMNPDDLRDTNRMQGNGPWMPDQRGDDRVVVANSGMYPPDTLMPCGPPQENIIMQNMMKQNMMKQNMMKQNMMKQNMMKQNMMKQNMMKQNMMKQNMMKQDMMNQAANKNQLTALRFLTKKIAHTALHVNVKSILANARRLSNIARARSRMEKPPPNKALPIVKKPGKGIEANKLQKRTLPGNQPKAVPFSLRAAQNTKVKRTRSKKRIQFTPKGGNTKQKTK